MSTEKEQSIIGEVVSNMNKYTSDAVQTVAWLAAIVLLAIFAPGVLQVVAVIIILMLFLVVA